ncbi:MAG: kinetochore spc25 [Lasallia pustulata]|uniref:Kinetochore protein SPC25 n=1 Tax=Lasallia pustulata TaxID=136370 RepID=A0A5M8PF47_9LECA|nr:MAG: kinetochore spc25 [Lasallia pustulata]
MMATLFEPSLSTSVLRAPFPPATAPSMADSLPSINFGFDELRDRMARFTDRFDQFIAKGRKRVLEERNQFRMNMAELHEDQRMKKKAIEILTHKSATHASLLQKEAAESADLHASIALLTDQRDARLATRESVRHSIAETQKQIAQRLAAQQSYSFAQQSQAQYNAPELEFWESNLCMRIEGAGQEDRLKFVYTHVHERDWEREAWFEIDMGRRDYRVVTCRPKVEAEGLERVVERLNENRDLGIFLKGMRELFGEAMR